jgi:hypothetical protein
VKYRENPFSFPKFSPLPPFIYPFERPKVKSLYKIYLHTIILRIVTLLIITRGSSSSLLSLPAINNQSINRKTAVTGRSKNKSKRS